MRLNGRRTTGALLLALSVALTSLSCSGDDDADPKEAKKGGTLRIASTSFEFTAGLDPTGEYLTHGFEFFSCCLIRTLMGYKHLAGPEGNELIPDLAAAEPDVSADGRTYTFTLRDGIRFAPPVNREVTARDVAYAFERIGTKSLVAQYGHYYDPIEGMAAFKEGKAKAISGIGTPDDKTITFRLTKPVGDFPYRLAMPATGPIPAEVARCFTKAGEYGRFLIASGPYMLEGTDNLDISGCGAMKPISGWDPRRHLRLVRNPNYDPKTDFTEARKNFLDGISYTINTNLKDIYARIDKGELDMSLELAPREVLRRYATSEKLKERFKSNPSDGTQYLSLNLTQPPFDDVHVRRAVNFVMDKEGLRRAAGGPVNGEIAHHIVPDTMFNDELEDYRPYGTEGDSGDLEKAKAEMRQSRYDKNRDGICDASACDGVVNLTATFAPYPELVPIIDQAFAKLGIKLVTRELESFFPTISDVSKNVAVASAMGWAKDYADASTFMGLFDGRNIAPQGNFNHALVGLTPKQAGEVKAKGSVSGVPSVDADIDRCTALSGDERLQCWQDLDKRLMEEVVPWIPWLFPNAINIVSEAVTRSEYDQAWAAPSFAHTAVDPAKQK